MSGETFSNLLAPNLASVRRFVQIRLRTADHADDVLQQTLLLAFTKRHQLRAPSKFRSWLWSIALNEIRAFRRRGRPSVSLDDCPVFELAYRGPCPLSQYEHTERAERLRAGMATLTERDRAAIRMVDLNGLSIAEAASSLAVSKAAAKSTHYRARQRLVQALRADRVES
jgi:RNA polymerase sigma-70 factor (ECF subfamily)